MPRPRTARGAVLVGVLVLAVGPLAAPVAAEEPAARTVVGELVRVQAEPRSPEEATALHEAPLTYVEPAQGAAVRLTGAEAEELPVGATVEVRVGQEVEDAPAAESGIEPARDVLAAEVLEAAADTPTVAALHHVTVAMVAPAELAVPTAASHPADAHTPAEVAAVVEGPVSSFWSSQTGGAISFDAVVHANSGWRQSTISCEDWEGLWTEAAAEVGFVDGPNQHLLLYLPEASPNAPPSAYQPCAYGWGDIGTAPGDGGRFWVRDNSASVIAHELGHNFGLGHSSLTQCDGSIERPLCEDFPYLDFYDVMGISWDHIGSLNPVHGHQLGFLGDADVHLVDQFDATAEYTLAPIGTRTGRVALRLSDGEVVYWLEYRTSTGQDDWLAADPDLEEGVLLRHEGGWWQDSSVLLDGTPSYAVDWDTDLRTVLPAGRSFRLGHGAFQVTVKSATPSQAVVQVATRAGAPVPRDLSGDYAADLMTVDSAGVLFNYPASASGGFGTRTVSGRGWQNRDLVTAVGDWDGDDAHDVVARDRRNGDLWLYRGDNAGGFGAWGIIGRGWGGFSALLSPGDWNGDGANDLIARRRSDGALILYPGNGTGGFEASLRIGSGWNSMTAFAATGDWDANGFVDFVARRNDGVLFLYPGDGSGRFSGAPRVIGRGWQVFTAVTGPGDWDGDGLSDLLVRRTDGSVWLYRGDGEGLFGGSRRIGTGWGGLRVGS